MGYCLDSSVLVYSGLYVYIKEFKLMIVYYILVVVGFILGYFTACIMMSGKKHDDIVSNYRIEQEDDGEY